MPNNDRQPVTVGSILKAIGWGAAIVVMLFFALVNVYACVAPYILLAQHLN